MPSACFRRPEPAHGRARSAGELAAAASLFDEVEAVGEATGSRLAPYGALALAAWRGREAEVSHLIEARMRELVARGEERAWPSSRGRARCSTTASAATRKRCRRGAASDGAYELLFSAWALVELIEAAVRSGEPELAADALEPALGGDRRRRHRLGAGHRGPLARAAQRRRGRRAPLPRGDRAARPHADPRRARSRPSPLRRMAAPRATAPGCPRAAAHRARDARGDGHGGVRRSAPRASWWPPARPPANAPSRRRTSSPHKRRRSPGSPATVSRTPRSAPGCSSARAPSSTTSTRSTQARHHLAQRARRQLGGEAGAALSV